LQLIDQETTFLAVDGPHYAKISTEGRVSLQMKEVADVKVTPEYVFMDTGSPHHVTVVNDLKSVRVKEVGKQIRNSDLYGIAGSNVNFVAPISETLFALRTYERGVEDETLSCGTGATAAAIAMHALGKTTATSVTLHVEGGVLDVSFETDGLRYTNVFLMGPAQFVFEGQVDLDQL